MLFFTPWTLIPPPPSPPPPPFPPGLLMLALDQRESFLPDKPNRNPRHPQLHPPRHPPPPQLNPPHFSPPPRPPSAPTAPPHPDLTITFFVEVHVLIFRRS